MNLTTPHPVNPLRWWKNTFFSTQPSSVPGSFVAYPTARPCWPPRLRVVWNTLFIGGSSLKMRHVSKCETLVLHSLENGEFVYWRSHSFLSEMHTTQKTRVYLSQSFMGASHYIDPNFQAQAITVEGRFPPADSNTSASSSDPPLASRPAFISQEILTNYIQHIMTLISFSRSIMCARQINGDRSIVGATMEYR